MHTIQRHGIRRWLSGCALAAALTWQPHFVSAQSPTSQGIESVQPGETVFRVISAKHKISLTQLETFVLELSNKIAVVDGFDPDKLTVTALSPHRIRLRGISSGVTTVKLIDEFDNLHVIEVFIRPDTRELQAYIEEFFPGTNIRVTGLRDSVVIQGWVAEPAQIPQIVSVAETFYPVVQNQLQVGGVNLVQLQVKVIEVQRTKLRELGFNFLSVGRNYFLASTTGGLAPAGGVLSPSGDPGLANLSFAVTRNDHIFRGFLKALQEEMLAKILAEPVLTTTSGRPAQLHSGGQFPFQTAGAQGVPQTNWKDYGVKIETVPIVLGRGRVRLDVFAEVSERDYSTAEMIGDQLVSGVSTRSVNTQIELNFGETLMVGGLISNKRIGTTKKLPIIGEIPIIGTAFSYKNYDIGETELVILVTPQVVSGMSPHQVPAYGPGENTVDPTMRELFLDGMLEVPNYGPDCPDCPPMLSSGFTSHDMGVPYSTSPSEQLPTLPDQSLPHNGLPAGELEPTPSSNFVNPFQSPIEQTSGQRTAPAPRSGNADSRNSVSANSPSSVREPTSATGTLPGLIPLKYSPSSNEVQKP